MDNGQGNTEQKKQKCSLIFRSDEANSFLERVDFRPEEHLGELMEGNGQAR